MDVKTSRVLEAGEDLRLRVGERADHTSASRTAGVTLRYHAAERVSA